MRVKMQKRLRRLALSNGGHALIDLPLEFEGKRVFVVWDQIVLGRQELKARIEVDPKLLQRLRGPGRDYSYRGQLILPRPQDN